MSLFPPPLLMVALACFTINLNASMAVQYSGCVVEDKQVFEDKQTLLKLLKTPNIQPCAYHFATALMQPRLMDHQAAQKAILLRNLQLLKSNTGSKELKVYLTALSTLINTQPVTGRVVDLELDATRVEIIPLQNKVFQTSLNIHFPSKLKSVYFIGSEKQEMLYRSAWTLDDYLKRNPLLDFFEKGVVHVVQANTSIEKPKVGYWNHNDYYISPGGWVIGLLKQSIIAEVAPSFNEDLAQWFATQVLP